MLIGLSAKQNKSKQNKKICVPMHLQINEALVVQGMFRKVPFTEPNEQSPLILESKFQYNSPGVALSTVELSNPTARVRPSQLLHESKFEHDPKAWS
jgi:hypothetical protein